MEAPVIARSVAHLPGIDLFYMDTKTDGPAILCLHGRWGRAETWMDFIRRYGKRYRVVAPDQRGHGLSGKPVSTYSAEEMAGDMAALLDHLEIRSAIVAGHSMGGRVAGHLAALRPLRVRALAILDKSPASPEKPVPPPPEQIPAVDPLTKDWPMPFGSLREASAFVRRATDSELEYQYFMNSLAETVEGYRMMFSAQAIAANIAYEREWYDLFKRIRCPALVLRARGSGAVSDGDFAKMQDLLPVCMARQIDDSNHNVHLARPEEFYAHFDEFLAWACR